MSELFAITVQNKFNKEKRDINVYHHAGKSAHIISYNSAFTFPFNTDGEDDYLHISIVYGPGNLWKEYLVNLPSWADFEFSSEGKVSITHCGPRTILKLPPGPPIWQLKMTRPTETPGNYAPDHVTIGEVETNGCFSR